MKRNSVDSVLSTCINLLSVNSLVLLVVCATLKVGSFDYNYAYNPDHGFESLRAQSTRNFADLSEFCFPLFSSVFTSTRFRHFDAAEAEF